MANAMERIVVHEHPKISVWYYPAFQLIHHRIHSICYNEPFREALAAGTDAMLQHRADRWLSDDRENGPLSPEDEEWATKTWFPRTQSAGWKYWAMVLPVRVVGQLNVTRFVKMYSELGITARMFDDFDAGFAWIQSPTSEVGPTRR